MSGSAFAVTHHAFSSGAGRTSDGNGSHASTLKSPSYTKSVSWQHYQDTGNPLSVIPKYTINNSLNWTITQAFSASVNWTLYGRQKPRTHAETRNEDTGGLSGKELGAYSLVGTNFNYDINKNLRLNVGVSNILNKQIFRSSEGANTYNEPGRAYYAGVTASF